MAEEVNAPEDLFYTNEHEWVRIEGDTAIVGITDHAQSALGEITYVELPALDKHVQSSDELAAVESAKAASDIYAPISGVVSDVNTSLEGSPENINKDPYGEGWICKFTGMDPSEKDNLLTSEEYRQLLAQEST